jgi:hypothetical protein
MVVLGRLGACLTDRRVGRLGRVGCTCAWNRQAGESGSLAWQGLTDLMDSLMKAET